MKERFEPASELAAHITSIRGFSVKQGHRYFSHVDYFDCNGSQ